MAREIVSKDEFTEKLKGMLPRVILKKDRIDIAFHDGADPKRHQWCRYSGPGRGDCHHFIGVPENLNEDTCDTYGIPHGWCDYCWASYRRDQAVSDMVAARGEIDRLGEFIKEFFKDEPELQESGFKIIDCAIMLLTKLKTAGKRALDSMERRLDVLEAKAAEEDE